MAGTGLLVSDGERERAARWLRRHYADGRLSLEELEQRLDRVWVARTREDLVRLFGDLPSQRVHEGRKRFALFLRRSLPVHAAGWASANGLLIGIWALTGGGPEFWPAWALVPSTGALAWHAGGVYMIRRAVPGPRSRALRGMRGA
jgi:uncharacterized protein DUF1707